MKIRRESGISKYLTILLYLFPGNFVLQKDYCQPYYVTDPQNTLRKMQIVVVVIGFSKQSHDMRLKKHRRAGACSQPAVKSCEFTLVRRNRWCLLPAGASPRPTLYTMLIKSDNHNYNLPPSACYLPSKAAFIKNSKIRGRQAA